MFGALLVLSLLPILLPFVPPFYDAPNHLARATILSRYDDSAFYRSLFVTNWRIIPNLALDVALIALCKLLPPIWALKVYLGLIVVLTAGGFAALHRQIHGSLNAVSLGGFALVYTLAMFMGFMNFCMGIALLFWFCAAYLALASKPAVIRLGLMVPFALLLFFTHLLAFLFALLFALVMAMRTQLTGEGRPTWWRAPLELGLIAAGPAYLYVVFSPTRGETETFIWRAGLFKLVAVGNLYRSGLLPLDVVVAPMFLLGAACLVGGNRGRLAKFTLPLVVTLLVIFLIAPFGTLTTQVLDTRIPVLILAAALLGVPDVVGGTRRSWWGGGLLGGATVLQALGLAVGYRAGDGDIRELTRVYAALPPRSYVFLIIDPRLVARENGPYLRQHSNSPGIATATGERFVSDLFGIANQQPMMYRKEITPLRMAWLIPDDPRRPLQFVGEVRRRLASTGRSMVPAYVQYAASPDITPGPVPGTTLLCARPGLAVYRLD